MLINNVPQPSTITGSLATKPSISPGEAQSKFSNTLKEAIENVNEAEAASDRKTEALVNGNVDDLHNVMIAAQKASITLETTVQIQKKAIDAYNEIMRMQV